MLSSNLIYAKEHDAHLKLLNKQIRDHSSTNENVTAT